MNIETRFAIHPSHLPLLDTAGLRSHFLIEDIMLKGSIKGVHSLHDRFIALGIVPVSAPVDLLLFEEITKADYFLQRRELGIINTGGEGSVVADGEVFELGKRECLYIGKGCKSVSFESKDASEPAEFYLNSAPAHHVYPTQKATLEEANRVDLGADETCNRRTIYQYIHEDGIQSCQLVMGFTTLHPGSVWNTFPPHTHTRRMEVYYYFDLPEDQIVTHLMGDPSETRHLIMRNKQAVISPEWSIHAGAGTSTYSFVWGMAGENQSFTDMDAVSTDGLM